MCPATIANSSLLREGLGKPLNTGPGTQRLPSSSCESLQETLPSIPKDRGLAQADPLETVERDFIIQLPRGTLLHKCDLTPCLWLYWGLILEPLYRKCLRGFHETNTDSIIHFTALLKQKRPRRSVLTKSVPFP